MKQMYIITASGYGDDGVWHHVEYVTDDIKKGTDFVDVRNTLQETIDAAEIQIDKYMENWLKHNPVPEGSKEDVDAWVRSYDDAEQLYIENTYSDPSIKAAIEANLFGATWTISPINQLP